MPVTDFPPGLVEAAAEGHRDAILDLGHYLDERGDVRGKELLWRLTHRTALDQFERWLSYKTCPECGRPVGPVEPMGQSCDDRHVVYEADTDTYQLGDFCRYVLGRKTLVRPLLPKE